MPNCTMNIGSCAPLYGLCSFLPKSATTDALTFLSSFTSIKSLFAHR